MQKAPIMIDNSDVQEIPEGRITDMRIEAILAALVDGRYDEPGLDILYNELVQEFINDDAPFMLITTACKNEQHAPGLLYLSVFNMDYEVTHQGSPHWPGDFEYMPKAKYAVRCRYPDEEEAYSEWSPGVTPSIAAIAAIMQVCREISAELYNKGDDVILN